MKKWIKRICLFLGVMFLLLIIGIFVEWKMTVNAGKTRLAKVRAALDAAEPGWQLDDLNASRNAKLPPDDQNVALIAKKVIDQFPKEFKEWEKKLVDNPRLKLKLNELANPESLADVRKQFETIRPLITQLHEIRNFPTGGFKITFSEPYVYSDAYSYSDKIRDAIYKLLWQVFLSAQDNDPDSAIEACRTGAHLRHTIGDEPLIISQLNRNVVLLVNLHSIERTLAMTEPKKGLVELQDDLEKALQEKDFISAIDGIRAAEDRFYENWENGTLLAEYNLGFKDKLEHLYDKRSIREDHAQFLENVTAARDAMKLQGKERWNTLRKISFKGFNSRELVKYIEATIENEAKLRTMIVAIVCERYRQANGKWPEKLSDIPKEILKEIPLDSYVGGPVKYRKNATGVIIYTTGPDGVDDTGVANDASASKSKKDVGIQLFDPAHRRLPAEVKPNDKVVDPSSMP